MKYKKLSKEQIKISIDRLTRFKNTKEKYIRVFSDIIINNLIEPKYKKNEILNLDYEKITEITETIFNSSFPNSEKYDFNINENLKKYENSVYINDNETQALLNNRLRYYDAIEYLDSEIPVNVKWLKSLKDNNDLVEMRKNHYLKFPIEKVILVEGITEEILVPAFAKYLNFDFYQEGIQIIPAGGKNQVVKMYYKLIEELKLPIFLLLDRDAEENINQIKPKLRKEDKIHLVACGEFEDLLPISLIIKTLNNQLKNLAIIANDDFQGDLPMVKNLENIYKNKGLHEFKKAEFAKLVRDNITENTDLSIEIQQIIKEISNNTNKTLDSKICS